MTEPVGKEEGAKAPLAIGLLGFGTVGTAVYQLLQTHATVHAHRGGGPLAVRRVVVRHPEKPRTISLPPGLLSTDPESILDDPAIAVVVEVMGGLHPAKEYVERALSRGKAVVTANKELMSRYGRELLALAAAAGTDLFFEASVGGGIPIIRPLTENLAAGRLQQVRGVLNGTTNYILTRMGAGLSFAEALAEAQAAGYAEADPTADVEGHDAARKLAILAGIAFHADLDPDQIPTVGITAVMPRDLAWGAERGLALKLVAEAERGPDGAVRARVGPAYLPVGHPLAQVAGPMNAIWVKGAEVGETLFSGPGAGGMPTATAVVGDILAAARNRRLGVAVSRPWADRPAPVVPLTRSERFYLRRSTASGGRVAEVGSALQQEIITVVEKRKGVVRLTQAIPILDVSNP